jgi:Icc-related predicted phosphoesterase
LGLAALWILLAFVVELSAWRAHHLGRVPAGPSFRAAPRGDAEAPAASLAFLGDLQRGVSDVARPLAAALRDRPADLLVSSGDFVAHGEPPYYGILLDAFAVAGVDTPTRVVPGNHDLFPRGKRDIEAGRRLFESRFGERYWSVRVGPVLVVGVDQAMSGIDDDQERWLHGTLEDHGAGPWICVCHRPPRNVDEADARPEPDLLAFIALLEARPPLLVVTGHKHEYLEREVNGVTYVVNAHGGDVHGLDLGRGPFELLRVEVGPGDAFRHEITRHGRRPWLRAYWHQFCARCWSLRRGGGGAVLALPAALLLGLLRLRAPLVDATARPTTDATGHSTLPS